MKLKENILLHFTMVMFLVVSSVSFSLAYFLSKKMTSETIRIHVDVYPDIVKQRISEHHEIENFFRSPSLSPVPRETENFFEEFTPLGSVFRIKVWDAEGTIIWSDKKDIIGSNYRDNPNFSMAMADKVNYQIKPPTKKEHIFESDKGAIMEIYIPVKFGNEIVGVVELYEAADELFWKIQKQNITIWAQIIISGALIYILLFYIFLKAHRKQEATQQRLMRTQDAIIYTLAYQAEIRDVETGRHLDRTSLYVEVLAKDLQRSSPYSSYVTDAYIRDLVKGAPLHDVGKVGVPDAILHKNGKLNSDEMERMQKHTEYGANVIRIAEQKIAFQSFLTLAIEVTGSHHERWDGTGYPRGLAGDQIPLSARIMALADVYDALRSARCYKEQFSHEACKNIIVAEKGKQFDPHVVEAFLRQDAQFERISREYADESIEDNAIALTLTTESSRDSLHPSRPPIRRDHQAINTDPA